MKVKGGTYFWFFMGIVFVLLGAWKCYSVSEKAQIATSAGSNPLYGWIAAFVLAIVFLIWRCYRLIDEKRTVEFLIKERCRAQEIERRIKQDQADRERKWFEEQKVRV